MGKPKIRCPYNGRHWTDDYEALPGNITAHCEKCGMGFYRATSLSIDVCGDGTVVVDYYTAKGKTFVKRKMYSAE